MRQVVQIPALLCIHALVICCAENIDLIWTIWRKEINSSLVLKMGTFDGPACPQERGEFRGEG